MNIPTKSNPSSLPKVNVDTLAKKFLSAKEAAAQAETLEKALREQCLELAHSRHATKTEKGSIVVGNTHQIAVTEMIGKPAINAKLLAKLAPKAAKKVIKIETVTVIDEEVFQMLVETGEIPKETALKVLIPGGLRGERLNVGPIVEQE